MQRVRLHLDAPPRTVQAGIGLHGRTVAEDVFRLPDLWQLHLYDYEADLDVGGTAHAIRPGRVSLIPPDTEARFRYRGPSEHLYVHFRLAESGAAHSVPVMRDTGADLTRVAEALRRTVASPSTTRANAEVWTLLWRLADLPPEAPAGPVADALAYVEANLPRPLAVPDIAAAVGLSHNHLTRLFRAATGTTVVAHIRRRRLERARHLLSESTLSIPAVAAAVGVPDLQAFNKACRRELGAAPREIRAAGRGSTG
ncbi:Helix-turn-helix domain-containing protein [Glycomyces sambucus]|uniref:Helix-turn-helix domain-containing protein n=1 Tax=Glycomyces sambucus TaxID=380244 RepID=A0A1G9F3E1_9ACTN|nr:AraC family transcriptional regulator [Glycomyces sambucus]SDK82850.1 Helix-turn-helix domain-containing protein [Glycomyces sambucus]